MLAKIKRLGEFPADKTRREEKENQLEPHLSLFTRMR